MKRRIGQACSVVAVLVFAATAILWVRGFFIRDYQMMQIGDGSLEVSSYGGRIGVRWIPLAFNQSAMIIALRRDFADDVRYHFAGFAAERYDIGAVGTPVRSIKATVLVVPNWFVMFLAALLPIVHLVRRYRKPVPHACPGCGYDLRASPDACPECGRLV